MSKIQINPPKQSAATEQVSVLLYVFMWFVVFPVTFICFLLTIFKPELRPVLSHYLATGFFLFLGLLFVYWVVRQGKV